MKSLLIYFTFLFSSPDKEVITFRDMLHQSFYSSDVAEQYYSKTKHINNSSPAVLKGYKAMAEFIMCKHTYNPFSKLIYFNRGKKELDAAIKTEPENVELLFYVLQPNAMPLHFLVIIQILLLIKPDCLILLLVKLQSTT